MFSGSCYGGTCPCVTPSGKVVFHVEECVDFCHLGIKIIFFFACKAQES